MSHQSQLVPAENKFHSGNGADGKHYWLTPWRDPVFVALEKEFGPFDFDPCPHPLPDDFDGLTCEWGQFNYVNPPFGSIIHQGRKKGPTAWVRKAKVEQAKGRSSLLVYPVDKWLLMLLPDSDLIRNLGDVRWLSTEDGQPGKGTGRHIAAFILRGAVNWSEGSSHSIPDRTDIDSSHPAEIGAASPPVAGTTAKEK